jgi:hypothetical protein
MRTKVLSTVQGPASMSSPAPPGPRTVGQRVWVGVSSAGAVVLGVLPHVLHHVGLFAGALLAGVGGSLLFGAVGFLAAIPFLLRVHRRTGTWRAPAVLLALFAVIFSISTFVIGPAITAGPSAKNPPASEQVQPTTPRPPGKDIHGH